MKIKPFPPLPEIPTAEEYERRIKELEEGACRYNCRTAKQAFIAGFVWGDSDDYHRAIGVTPESAYEEWKKLRGGSAGENW